MAQKKKEPEHLLSNLREFQVINWHNRFLCFALCLHEFVSWHAFLRWNTVLVLMDMNVYSLLTLLSLYRMSGWFLLLAWQQLPRQVLFIFSSHFSILVQKAIWPGRRSTVWRVQGLWATTVPITCKIMLPFLACVSPVLPQSVNWANWLIP